ncbi:MAG: sulfate adenylyltransferase, partial [Rubrobacteraceae bacterium]
MNVETEYTTSVPHGGTLVNRRAPEDERDERTRRAQELRKIAPGPRTLSDLEMISTGVFSPLTGFMVREDYESVVETMRLPSGLVWSMPITLSVGEDEANSIGEGEEIALTAGDGQVVATMLVEDRYTYEREREARQVYRTTDRKHPGVDYLYRQGDVFLGGEVTLLVDEPNPRPFPG